MHPLATPAPSRWPPGSSAASDRLLTRGRSRRGTSFWRLTPPEPNSRDALKLAEFTHQAWQRVTAGDIVHIGHLFAATPSRRCRTTVPVRGDGSARRHRPSSSRRCWRGLAAVPDGRSKPTATVGQQCGRLCLDYEWIVLSGTRGCVTNTGRDPGCPDHAQAAPSPTPISRMNARSRAASSCARSRRKTISGSVGRSSSFPSTGSSASS